MMVKVFQEFWRILCQIRIIKYCAEPSVRELPQHEGSLQRRANLWVLFQCRRLLLEELPSPSGGLQQPSNQAVISTCHALRWRQRYCQTRYTRRRYDLIPSDKSRSLTLGYTQVSDLLSHWVISKSYRYGNEPLSVPTTTKVNCITTYQEYEVYTPAFN